MSACIDEGEMTVINEMAAMSQTKQENIGEVMSQNSTQNNRHRWTTNDEWEQIKETIVQLYQKDGHEVKTIKAIIEMEYGFTATVGMYKKRLHGWGLGKSLSSDEKKRLGRMAEELIAEGRPLPTKDEMGNTIPWNRVRQHYGLDKIPLHHLPVWCRNSRRGKTLEKQESPNISLVPKTGSRVPKASQTTLASLSIAQRSKSSIIRQPLRADDLEETLIFYTKEWYSWCAVSARPGSNENLVKLNDCHARVHFAATKGQSIYLHRGLWKQATTLQDALRNPSAMLLASILRIWSMTQSAIYDRHGYRFASFLLASCNEILGSMNPLHKILSVLKHEAVELHKGSALGVERVDTGMSVAPAVLIDGLKHYPNANEYDPSHSKSLSSFVESLDSMLTWNLDACNPILAIRLMKDMFHRRLAILQSFRELTARTGGTADAVALRAQERLLDQQMKIGETVGTHNAAGLPLVHRAMPEMHCASLKTMALASEQATKCSWLDTLNAAKDAPIRFHEDDCFVGMMVAFRRLTLEEKTKHYGKEFAESFNPSTLWVPQWRRKYFPLFTDNLEDEEVDEWWSDHLSKLTPQHTESV